MRASARFLPPARQSCVWARVAFASAVAAALLAPGVVAAQSIFADGFECRQFADADGDGFGNPLSSIVTCAATPGHVENDDDCNDANPAVNPGATDWPDAQFLDQDCDGIDGDIARAAFVAPGGADNGMCRIAAPCATIAHAIAAVVADASRDQVYLRNGTYNEVVTLAAGTSVFGGYNSTWVAADRSVPGHLAKILGGIRANLFNLAAVGMPAVGNLAVESVAAATPGQSSIAVLLTNSPNVAFARVDIRAAAGAAGIARSIAATGSPGGIGGQGNPGCENSTLFCEKCDRPAGGLMGESACGRNGGVGGLPGLESDPGLAGGIGSVGTPGGPGAACESCDGTVGGTGAPGGPGSNGIGGANIGLFAAGTYGPAAGSAGGTGGHGNGGGGGGGGGGGTTDCDSYGSSGGGGGGGGCGGEPGLGGGGGGASLGVVLQDSSATLSNSTIASGSGGAGGTGGLGGTGGTGGDPGPGGPYGGSSEQDDGGFGAAGGRGGDGGPGGDGGGGGGGPSVAILCVGASTASFATSTLTPGTGGQGGASAASVGNAGLSAASFGCGA